MTDQEIMNAYFGALIAEYKAELDEKDRPLLAHYTTLDVLESILHHSEIWLSNPLFMNDREELNFGILNGVKELLNSAAIGDALGNNGRKDIFAKTLNNCLVSYDRDHLLDTYIVCLTRHEPDDNDGVLSMWRAYGANGNGVALVFDTSKITATNPSPLFFAPVKYGSTSERIAWLKQLSEHLAKQIRDYPVPDDKLYIVAAAAFERLKLFALFTKNVAFKEEGEWRLVCMSERDEAKALESMQHYHIGPNGIEPKLKFKIAPLSGITSDDLSLDRITARIILGPSASTRSLSLASVKRMLKILKVPHLQDRLVASQIPFRPK